MRYRFLTVIALAAAILTGAHLKANAQITLDFATPEFLDPNVVIVFTSPGTQTVSGGDLISDPMIPFSPGVEVHSRIPGPNGGFLDINSLELQFDYSGVVSVNPVAPPTPGYTNWTVQSLSVGNNHYDIIFVRGNPQTSAPINDNFNPGPGYPSGESFAGIGVTGDVVTFSQQNPPGNVKITVGSIGVERGGTAVPEPGAMAMCGGLGVTLGGWLVQRRRPVRRR